MFNIGHPTKENSLNARFEKKRILKFLKSVGYGFLAIILGIIVGVSLFAHFLGLKQLYKIVSDYVQNREDSFLETQLKDIENLLSSAGVFGKIAQQGFDFWNELEGLIKGGKKGVFRFSESDKKEILGHIYELVPKLEAIKSNLDLALVKLNNIQGNGVLKPVKNSIENLKSQLEKNRDLLAKAIPMLKILPSLAGYPQKSTYLVFFQNNDELRPTGGFLGTFCILNSEYGEILRSDTYDIYHLDMPVQNKLNIEPPEQLKRYLGCKKWFLRDANWSPDWPTAAKEIKSFYEKENNLLSANSQITKSGEKFDGVIAITPKFITDLLAITGPVFVEGQSYTKDNFVDLLQYRVEKGYLNLGIPSWHRKGVISEIVKQIKIKLFDLPSFRWKEVINAVYKNFEEKNILIAAENAELANFLKVQGWDGELKPVQGDYLMVVDANMGSAKTDNVMEREIDYKVEQREDGLFAKLKITYKHTGNVDWKTTRYRTYTRIYAPQGSKLIKSSGHTNNDVEVKDEFGKTSFGVFLSIEPKTSKYLYFEYKLPDRINNKVINDKNYDLYVQKQPGNKVNSLITEFTFLDSFKEYSSISSFIDKKSDRHIIIANDLNTDKSFWIKW